MTAVTSRSPIRAIRWVSDPVGSTTDTVAARPLSESWSDSGRRPSVTSRPSATPGTSNTVSPTTTPPAAPRPAIRFIEGEPMKPATKVLAGRS